MKKLKVGLLPLYVELYDISCPEVRPDIDAAHENTIRRLRETGLEVVTWSVCRLAEEFSAAIAHFEKEQVDALVGKVKTGRLASSAAAFAVSMALPPPMAKIISTRRSLA